ncbi:MAG TPA: hypothetical protein PKA36_12680, partial [Pseudoxanthomonas mexicana]|nr:hypothetical protein [Pseudoxanthomonas mexicana]
MMSCLRTLRRGCIAWGLLALLASPAFAREAVPATPLQFRIIEGRIENAFYQDGPVAAHLLLSSGARPRVLVAFPAGNSGVGVWFEETATPVQWILTGVDADASTPAGALHGIRAQTTVDAERLVITDAVLGSVRVLREYQLGQGYPPETRATPAVTPREVTWERARLDGAPGYR